MRIHIYTYLCPISPGWSWLLIDFDRSWHYYHWCQLRMWVMGYFHTVLVFSHFINLAISLQRQNIRTPKFVLLYNCILSISTQIFRAIPHIFFGQFTDQCCSTCSTVLSTSRFRWLGKKSHKTDICQLQGEYINAKYSVKQGNFYTKGERVTKSGIGSNNASILGEWWWSGQRSKIWLAISVPQHCLGRTKNISICRVHLQLFDHILYFTNCWVIVAMFLVWSNVWKHPW